jgi:hypothetical protein
MKSEPVRNTIMPPPARVSGAPLTRLRPNRSQKRQSFRIVRRHLLADIEVLGQGGAQR